MADNPARSLEFYNSHPQYRKEILSEFGKEFKAEFYFFEEEYDVDQNNRVVTIHKNKFKEMCNCIRKVIKKKIG